uniref:Endonuclease/exonuclease/phosphatase domain-containing protein n=1 Tax=Labrus bergylta TaxID=56723 RepID=A0A3Q3NF89_9LABR
MSGDIKITSLNVNGLNNPIKRKKVLQKMKREGGNVMFLQENHLSREDLKKLERLTNAQVHSASFHSARRGVAILITNFETIKMNILPRFMFLFQNLPTCSPQNNFNKWDKLLNTFVWGGKKA